MMLRLFNFKLLYCGQSLISPVYSGRRLDVVPSLLERGADYLSALVPSPFEGTLRCLADPRPANMGISHPLLYPMRVLFGWIERLLKRKRPGR